MVGLGVFIRYEAGRVLSELRSLEARIGTAKTASETRMGAALTASEARRGAAIQALKHSMSQENLNLSHKLDKLPATSKSFSCIFKLIASSKIVSYFLIQMGNDGETLRQIG